MSVAEVMYEIDFFQDLKKAGMTEEQATVILKLVKSNNQEFLNKTLNKTDIKELEWKIEGLRKDTKIEIEELRKDTATQIEELRKDTVTQIEGLRKDTISEINKIKYETLKANFLMLSPFYIFLLGLLINFFTKR